MSTVGEQTSRWTSKRNGFGKNVNYANQRQAKQPLINRDKEEKMVGAKANKSMDVNLLISMNIDGVRYDIRTTPPNVWDANVRVLVAMLDFRRPYTLKELAKMFPQAYNDRTKSANIIRANSNMYGHTFVSDKTYEGRKCEWKFSLGCRAANNGRNPWDAIVSALGPNGYMTEKPLAQYANSYQEMKSILQQAHKNEYSSVVSECVSNVKKRLGL